MINVSGGTAGSNLGGTVNFRAPLLADGATDADGNLDTQGDVNIFLPTAFNTNRGILGSGSTTLEAYAVWSTTDTTTGAQHFDGIVDPAGWYDTSGNLLSGTFTTQSGANVTYTAQPGTTAASISNDPGASATQIATDLTNDLTNDDFAPNAVNNNHAAFYGYQSTTTNSDGTETNTPGTLMDFVENGLGTTPAFAPRFAAVSNFQVAPGIELDNPDTAINAGQHLDPDQLEPSAPGRPTTAARSIPSSAIKVSLRRRLPSGRSAMSLPTQYHRWFLPEPRPRPFWAERRRSAEAGQPWDRRNRRSLTMCPRQTLRQQFRSRYPPAPAIRWPH